MDDAVLAGVAAFDAGRYAAAREVWAGERGDDGEGNESASDDGNGTLRGGLAAFADVVVRGRNARFAELSTRAREAREALEALGGVEDGVDVDAVVAALDAIAADPEVLERRRPPYVTVGGDVVAPADLPPESVFALAPALAASLDYDADPVERAVRYARADRDAGEASSAFVTLVYDFVGDADARPVAYRRLVERGDRREAKEADVEGLFE